jgi:hypothetical protein
MLRKPGLPDAVREAGPDPEAPERAAERAAEIAKRRPGASDCEPMEMDAERQAFVDAAIKPLGDDEARRDLLEKAVALAETLPAPVGRDGIRRATERMARTSRRFPLHQRLGRATVTAVAMVVPWLTVAGPAARESLAGIWTANLTTAVTSTACCSRSEVGTLPGIPEAERDHRFIRHVEKQVPPADLALLAGDFLQKSPSARWKPVWDALPRDPWHYHAYALAFRSEHKRWPERFVETGEELDPGNGWFRLMRGASRMEAAIGPAPPPRITKAEKLAARAKGLPPPKVPAITGKPPRVVLDAKAFQEGWDDLAAALEMRRMEDYRSRLDAIRLEAYPDPIDYPDLSSYPVLYVGSPEFYGSGWMELNRYAEAFQFAADQAAKAADRERLLEIGRLHSRTVRASCHGSYGLFPGLIARRLAKEGALGLSKAWADLGEPAVSGRYRTLADHLDVKINPDPQAPPDALTEHRGSNLANAATGFRERGSPDSPPVAEPELRGGRLAEYAMYERLMMHSVALLLTLALAFLLLVPWRSRKELGLLPERLAGLLERRDHGWIGLFGVLLPVGLYVFSTRVPWMEPREFSLSGNRFLLWITQALALVVAIVLGTLQATRWRLGRRGSVLALGWVGVDPGRLFYPVALALIPIASVLSQLAESWNQPDSLAAALVASLLVFPLLWVAMLALGCFRHAPDRTLHRATLMVAARPFVALATVASVFAISALHREEKHWTARADFDAMKSGHSVFVPRFEIEYGQWIARETLRRLDEMEK